MGLQMVRNNNVIGPDDLLRMSELEIIFELEARGARGSFYSQTLTQLRDTLIDMLWPENSALIFLHSECR